MEQTKYYGVFKKDRNFYTIGSEEEPLYGEKILTELGMKYRLWFPYRSKMAAALQKNIKHYPFTEYSKVLYLGASFGNTVSFISDICKKGQIFAIEKSVPSFKGLLKLAELRKNIYPILEDANHPDRYDFILNRVNVVYQDIAQKNQVEIFKKNTEKFLDRGIGILMLKTRAVDVTKTSKAVLDEELKKLSSVVEVLNLNPFEKDHFAVAVKRL